jgi:hypothetical protein
MSRPVALATTLPNALEPGVQHKLKISCASKMIGGNGNT